MILLIRHGETDQNASRVVQPPGSRLSTRGETQARLLAQRLKADGVQRILSSDLERARATAAAIELSTRVGIEFEPLLQERNFGDLRGTAYADLAVDLFGPDYAPPRGESWPVFHERVREAWAVVTRAAQETEGNLAVVTHGLVLRSIAEHHVSLGATLEPPAAWDNTALTVIEPAPPWSVRRINCTEHLDGQMGSLGVGTDGG